MKNLVQEFAEIVIKAKTEVEHPHKIFLVFAVYVLACLLAAKHVFVALVVDVVVAVSTFHRRLVWIFTFASQCMPSRELVEFMPAKFFHHFAFVRFRPHCGQ